MWRWYWLHRGAPQEAKDLFRHYFMRYGGPAGLTAEDDMENWNYAHKASMGVIARRYPYNYAMGLGHETKGHSSYTELDLPQNAIVTLKSLDSDLHSASEQNQRGAYSFWVNLMAAEKWDDLQARGLWP